MKNYFTMLLFLFFTNTAISQTMLVSGVVEDSKTNETLPGVNIMVKGTTNGTITNFEGYYQLSVNKGETLVFSFVGYSQVEAVIDRPTINMLMMADIMGLDEVVVIGYGTQKKSDITGSVSSIKPADLNPGPVLSVDNFLQNTAPGVVLTQSSSQPGGGFDIKIRGTSSILGDNGPLYVVDGLPITSENTEPSSSSRYRSSPEKNPLNGINPDDIVSIEILKDASATAIYGARGANGVILVTTKSGAKGKLKVNYSGSFSVQQLDQEYEMLDAKQFATLTNEYNAERNPGSDPVYSPAEINKMGTGTVWMDEITRMGSINKQQLSLSGGNEKVTYYGSGSYFKHKGVVDNSELQRISGRLNLTYKPIKKINMGVNLVGTNMHDVQVPFGASGGGGPEFSGLFDNTRTWSPIVPVYQPDGSYSRHPVIDNIPNPVSLLEIDDQINKNRFLGNTFIEYNLLNGLTAKVNLGFDYNKSKREAFVPITVVRGEQANGEAEIANTTSQNLLGEFTLNYVTTLADNDFSILGGATYQEFASEGDNLLLSNFADHASSIDEIQHADTLSNTVWKVRPRLLSYLGRVNYNISNKYLLTFSFRADGSSKFGTNNKWGFFPSGAFAWKIHNEDFFNSNVVGKLKMRASYGQIGNQEIGNFRSQSIYSHSRRTVIGGIPVSGFASLRPENQDLRWENSTQLNFGLDMSFLEDRIQTTFDVYQKVTTDVLLDFYLPSTSGYEVITANAGEILNKGVEFSLTTVNINKAFVWTSSFNFGYNKNNWVDRAGYYPAGKAIEEEQAVVEGIYGYVVEGIFESQAEVDASNQPNASPGMFIFKDVSGDGEITPADRTLLGKGDPDFTLGLNNQFSYKNFDLSFFFQGMIGREKDNYTRAGLEDITNLLSANNKTNTVLDRWTPSNPEGSVHSGYAPSDGGDNYNNSHYIQDASFVRLRNVTLSYTIQPKKHISNIRIYVDVQNLLTFTNYDGLDPETDEFRQYPNAKTFSFGFNVTF